MESKDNGNKNGRRKKLVNIISKLAEHQLNKTSENEDKNSLCDETFKPEDAGVPITDCTSESKRKSKRKPMKTLKTSHNQQNVEQHESNLTVVKAFNSDEDSDKPIEEKDVQNIVKEEKKTSKKKRKKRETVSSDDLPRIINCSSCNKSIHIKSGKICRHPDLNTLTCKKCYKFYNSGKFTKDEYGVEEYCRWCADGGDLICCDFCEKAFCKECVKRNLGKSKLKELLEADEDEQWNCFCCDPDPISSKILLCNRVMRFLDEKKDQHTPYRDKKGREIIHGPNTSERRNLLTSMSGEQTVRAEDASETSFSKKTYSKRFQNGMNSTTEKNGQGSKERVHVKKESNETEKDVFVLSDEETEGSEKQNGNQSKKRNNAGVKPKKLRESRKNRNKDEEADNISSDNKGHLRTKSRGKVRETKSSRNQKLKESESDNDFVSMVKKGSTNSKRSSEKNRKRNKMDTSSSENEESDNESGEVESNEASGKKGGKSRTRKVLSSSNEENGDKSDSDDEDLVTLNRKRKRVRKPEKKKEKKNKRWGLRSKVGESDETDSDDASDEDTPKKRKSKKQKRSKNKKQNKKKRKRADDKEQKEEEDKDTDEDDDDDDDDENMSPSKRKGRKKIRKILDNEKLEEATKHARKLEEERRKRLVERTKATTFEKPASVDLKEVVLELDPDGETPVIKVDEDIVKHLKPHQVEGVKFMYDCTIESLKSWEKKEEGGGCILAHVMGLGKTLQIVTLVHTLYRSELIQLRRILVVCPLNTVLNWQVEFEKWLSVDDRLDIFVLNDAGSNNWHRADMLNNWHKYGGVLIMGYTMYRNLSQCLRVKSKHQRKIFKESLVDPGPELVVCDEGHILRNSKSAISIAMNAIKTKRRIVLTGTPLQNNLVEYHCMVSFVKPSLLGTIREFSNSFIHPIQNGQCADSTDSDVRIMKNRCHVLHKMLKGCVQRKDYADIAQFLPPKFEYVIKIRLSDKQREMYKYYLETFLTTDGGLQSRGGSLFSDYQALMRIWTHPWCLRLESSRQIERFIDTDDSMADFVVESEEEESALSSEEMSWTSDSSEDKNDKRSSRRRGVSSSSSAASSKKDADSDRNDVQETESLSCTTKDSTRIKMDPDQPSTSTAVVVVVDDDVTDEKPSVAGEGDINRESEVNPASPTLGTLRSGQEFKEEVIPEEEWYDKFLKEEDETNIELGSKLVLLLEILADAAALDEKVLVFSHSLVSLDLIEKALGGGQIGGNKMDWCRGCDYFRMDGSTGVQMRKRWSDIFNDEENKAARLFLISTKAGGLGINLIGASRVIVFDISWNPSHDVQSIFRAYRFGQNKPVFVYRFIAEGSMEEKIYDRQVTKLSVSQRVVDEHQIQRHFNANDLAELYRFEPDIIDNADDERPTPAIPKDAILAELINRLYPKWIVSYHEHDSLLRNRPEEELSEAERKEAWEHYEAEKQGLNNRIPFMQNGVNINSFNADMVNTMNTGVTNLINPTSVSIPVPNTSISASLVRHHPMIRPVGMSHVQLQQQQQQQSVLEEQRRRLFEYERQRIEIEKRREKELREREVALRQMEIRRQEEIRARRAREHGAEEQRRQMEAQQNRQFLQQLLHNQNPYVAQQSGSRAYPAGQSTYRVVVNSAPRPQSQHRSPPRIVELPPDA